MCNKCAHHLLQLTAVFLLTLCTTNTTLFTCILDHSLENTTAAQQTNRINMHCIQIN